MTRYWPQAKKAIDINEQNLCNNIKKIIACPICLEDCPSDPYITSCGHVFCKNCIVTWRTVNNSCPSCKSTISSTVRALGFKEIVHCISLYEESIRHCRLIVPQTTANFDGTEMMSNVSQDGDSSSVWIVEGLPVPLGEEDLWNSL